MKDLGIVERRLIAIGIGILITVGGYFIWTQAQRIDVLEASMTSAQGDIAINHFSIENIEMRAKVSEEPIYTRLVRIEQAIGLAK